MATEAKSTPPAMTNPFGDLTKMLEQFKVPGVDMTAFVDARRQDVAALAAANKAAFDGLQALARTQAEMLTETMQGLSGAAQGLAAGPPDTAAQAEAARAAWDKMVGNMKTLAELAQSTQAEALASLSGRAQENLAEMRQLLQPK